ncbi:MAG: LysR family transcriptional regulator [Phycisphaerae bacterium]|nr:LysR family transcriptional regulator [Phycisphaerae bacterium]
MQIETLKIFCDLADLQSFSKTADRHFLSQSAVSQQLAQLELAYKCQLINRKKRPIELTKEGQLFYTSAIDILERHEQLRSELNALKSSTESRINVAAIYSIGMHTLPAYIKKFMVKYPNVNVNIEYFRAGRIYELILSNDADIGLVAIPKKDKRMDVYEFEDEPLVLACSPKHPLSRESQIDIHQLQFERFIGFEKDTPTRIWIDNIFERYNIVLRPAMEFDNVETIKRAVEINSGISILPQTVMIQEVNNGTIKTVGFSNEDFIRPTGIIVRKGKLLGQTGRYFIEILCKKA